MRRHDVPKRFYRQFLNKTQVILSETSFNLIDAILVIYHQPLHSSLSCVSLPLIIARALLFQCSFSILHYSAQLTKRSEEQKRFSVSLAVCFDANPARLFKRGAYINNALDGHKIAIYKQVWLSWICHLSRSSSLWFVGSAISLSSSTSLMFGLELRA